MSLKNANEFVYLLESEGRSSFTSPEYRDRVIDKINIALDEARLVGRDTLQRYPGLAEHYEQEFIPSLKRFRRGFEEQDWSATISAGLLMNQWVEWINANKDSLALEI